MPGDGSRAHLPAPSYFPILLSAGLPVIAYGLIFNMAISAVGAAMALAGFVGWALEPADDLDLPPHGHDEGGSDGGDDHDGDAVEADAAEVETAEAEAPATDAPAAEEEVTVGD